MTSRSSDSKKIGAIIRSIQVGMLTTVQANGELRCRPMFCADCDFDSLWFLVKESKPPKPGTPTPSSRTPRPKPDCFRMTPEIPPEIPIRPIPGEPMPPLSRPSHRQGHSDLQNPCHPILRDRSCLQTLKPDCGILLGFDSLPFSDCVGVPARSESRKAACLISHLSR